MTIFFRANEDFSPWGDPDNGEVKPTVSLVDDPKFKGEKSFKCHRTGYDASVMWTWKPDWHGKERYFGFAVYVPSSMSCPQWGVMLELNQDHPFRHIIQLLYGFNGTLGTEAFNIAVFPPDGVFKAPFTPIRIPRDRWVTIIIYCRVDPVDGQVVMWMDGNRVVNSESIPLMFEREAITSLMIGLYAEATNPPQEVFFDEIMIGDNLNEIQNELAPLIKKGCVVAFLASAMGLGSVLPSLRLLRSHLNPFLVETYYHISGIIMKGVYR